MARVYFSMLLLTVLSACTALDQTTPAANAQPDSMLSQAKGVLACTGLPVGGQKCALDAAKQQDPG